MAIEVEDDIASISMRVSLEPVVDAAAGINDAQGIKPAEEQSADRDQGEDGQRNRLENGHHDDALEGDAEEHAQRLPLTTNRVPKRALGGSLDGRLLSTRGHLRHRNLKRWDGSRASALVVEGGTAVHFEVGKLRTGGEVAAKDVVLVRSVGVMGDEEAAVDRLVGRVIVGWLYSKSAGNDEGSGGSGKRGRWQVFGREAAFFRG